MITLFKSPYRNIFILSLIVYLITAFFSEGYYHPDEHFQILEFCNYKLGNAPVSDMPWEFHENIRPALQPALAMLMIKILNLAGIFNPFTYTLIFRILTALFSWFVVCKTCSLLSKDFSTDTGKRVFIFLSLFLWFVPFISVRFSSENYSATTFLAAVYLIIRYGDGVSGKKLFPLAFAGLLLGFSFFFRFQVGFAILGLGMWLLLVKRLGWRNILVLIIAGTCSLAFCIYLDFWFYGKSVLTAVNYFFANIVENKAANWGIFPWWQYFIFFILQAVPPISILLLLFFFIGLYKRPANIFTWCMIPFLIAQFAVGHKEMRFMFPMVFGFIYLAAIGIDHFIIKGKYQKAGRFLFYLSVIINIPLLIAKMITPAQEAVKYYKFLYNYSPKQEVILLCREKNVYDLVGLNANFYRSPRIRSIVLNDDEAFSNYLDKNKPDTVLLLERKLSVENKFVDYKKESIYCLFPKWILRFNVNDWQSRSRIWNILELRKIK